MFIYFISFFIVMKEMKLNHVIFHTHHSLSQKNYFFLFNIVLQFSHCKYLRSTESLKLLQRKIDYTQTIKRISFVFFTTCH